MSARAVMQADAVEAPGSVDFVILPPRRVACVRAVGPSPEREARRRLDAWAGPRGLLQHRLEHRIFGYNSPAPGLDGESGYVLCISVPPEIHYGGAVELLDLPGGSFLVTRCLVRDGHFERIPEAWARLEAYRQAKGYARSDRQWLEEHLDERPDEVDLYLFLPVEPQP